MIKTGFKRGHNIYYRYVFDMKKVIGICPWGYPTKLILIYHSYNEDVADKFRIITAYPFSWVYYQLLKKYKRGF